MASTHPYRQGYSSYPLSQHSSVSPEPKSKRISQMYEPYHNNHIQPQEQHQHQSHPLRPLDRPYQLNRKSPPNASRSHDNPRIVLDSPLKSYSNTIAPVSSPHATYTASSYKHVIPSPPFRHGHFSSVSSIESDKNSARQVARAPDTPKGIAPSGRIEGASSVTSSPLLLSARLSDKSSINESTQFLTKPSDIDLTRVRSGSTLSLANDSFIDQSQNSITQHLGNNANSLLPKLKTIELYRANAKKSHDPEVIFQYARYILNTAIFINVETENDNESGSTSSLGSHKKTKSSVSLIGEFTEDPNLEERKALKKKFMKEAVQYLKKLSDRGYTDAQYLLADAYSSGAIGKKDDKEAFILFQGAAKRGHVESSYRTSFCYEIGVGTGRDSRKALEFLKFAATKNHPSAMYKMGLYSFYGRMGLSDNVSTKKEGIRWLKRACENANDLICAAPYELGKIHYEGFKDIVIQDKVYALELYRLAASLGHIQSAAILGKHYELGNVIPQDAELSIHYYTQAAMGGDAESMLGLCGWFMIGAGTLEKNEHEAFEWALKAANLGLPKAQFAAGHFLEKGIGCQPNQDAAFVWFQKAAEKGDERALKKLKGTKFEKNDEKKSWVKKLFS